MVRFLTTTTLALAMLAAPLFGANGNVTYLALGDSIAFGFDPTLFPPYAKHPAQNANKFTGYPEKVEDFVNKKEVNASCPGETSGSFLNVNAPDNGCHGPQGFKETVGLHTNYNGSQASFAASELASNKQINLVTLSIGGNDLLLLQEYCNKNYPPSEFAYCVGTNLPSVLTAYAGNLGAILGAIRANYHGTLVLMTSYAPSADPLFVQAIKALNQAMVDVNTVGHFDVKFADAFTAFQIASAIFQNDPCKAGLLIRLSKPYDQPVCDVHPSPIGRDILAVTVLLANH